MCRQGRVIFVIGEERRLRGEPAGRAPGSTISKAILGRITCVGDAWASGLSEREFAWKIVLPKVFGPRTTGTRNISLRKKAPQSSGIRPRNNLLLLNRVPTRSILFPRQTICLPNSMTTWNIIVRWNSMLLRSTEPLPNIMRLWKITATRKIHLLRSTPATQSRTGIRADRLRRRRLRRALSRLPGTSNRRRPMTSKDRRSVVVSDGKAAEFRSSARWC